jgi:hypothetical protein
VTLLVFLEVGRGGGRIGTRSIILLRQERGTPTKAFFKDFFKFIIVGQSELAAYMEYKEQVYYTY